MNRCSFCEWIPILPWPVWPLAGHARLGQNTVVGSMTILLSWLCWGACQEKVCLDPRFLCNLTSPRFSVELPRTVGAQKSGVFRDNKICVSFKGGYGWRTQKCRNMCIPYTFFEGKKAGKTSPRKDTPRTLEQVRQQYRV